MITAACFLLAACIAESAVLDPALYLVPSPPLVQARDSMSPAEMWGRSLEERTERIAKVAKGDIEVASSTEKPAAGSRMFWPQFSSPEPALGVHIPLTFSLSGAYGRVASLPSVIGNSYTSVSGKGTSANSNVNPLGTSLSSNLFGKSAVATLYGNYGRSALAGSSYGNYGSALRVYGGDNAAAWSGWGNGKWGHYGKG